MYYTTQNSLSNKSIYQIVKYSKL